MGKLIFVLGLLAIGCGTAGGDATIEGEWSITVNRGDTCRGSMTIVRVNDAFSGSWSCGVNSGTVTATQGDTDATLSFSAPSWQTAADAQPLVFSGTWAAQVSVSADGNELRGSMDYPGFANSEFMADRIVGH